MTSEPNGRSASAPTSSTVSKERSQISACASPPRSTPLATSRPQSPTDDHPPSGEERSTCSGSSPAGRLSRTQPAHRRRGHVSGCARLAASYSVIAVASCWASGMHARSWPPAPAAGSRWVHRGALRVSLAKWVHDDRAMVVNACHLPITNHSASRGCRLAKNAGASRPELARFSAPDAR